jgi:hypothetical protein
MGRYSGVLRQAAARGPAAAGATHYMLMQQDPQYREMYEQDREQE